MKRAKNIKNLKAHNKQLGLLKKVYTIFNKVDDADIYFLALQTFYRVYINKNIYNDWTHKEVARASTIGLRQSCLC